VGADACDRWDGNAHTDKHADANTYADTAAVAYTVTNNRNDAIAIANIALVSMAL
jgi:hypothetical protein